MIGSTVPKSQKFCVRLVVVTARISILEKPNVDCVTEKLNILSDLLQILRRQDSIFVCGPLHHNVFQYLGAVGISDPICCSFLTWFGHDFPAGQFVSVQSFLIAATKRYSGFFLLSLVTRFACDIGQSARIWT